MAAKHYLVPDYILNFKCAMCTECCKRWRINIDKTTVDKYEQYATADQEFAASLESNLKKEKDGGAIVQLKPRDKTIITEAEGEKKEITVQEARVCPFLDEEGYCAIQRKFGIESLSDTCKIFPRNIAITERGYEMAFTYACAAAANTLKKKEPVEFYMDPQGFDFPTLNGHLTKIGDVLERKKAGKTSYFEVEELLIDIMQFREMDVDTRLILAGIVVDKLKDGDTAGIRKYLQNLDETLIDQLKNIPSQPLFMMKLVKEAVDKRILGGITESNLSKLIALSYIQLKLLDEAIISNAKVESLLENYNKYYKPYVSGISHIYENYFVNFIFSKKFYTHKYMDAFFLMIFFYTLIRFFTICSCMAEERNVDEDMVVGVINAIERSIGHNSSFYEDVLKKIKQGDYHRLPYVLSLINL